MVCEIVAVSFLFVFVLISFYTHRELIFLLSLGPINLLEYAEHLAHQGIQLEIYYQIIHMKKNLVHITH